MVFCDISDEIDGSIILTRADDQGKVTSEFKLGR